jgi:hypothetical protein
MDHSRLDQGEEFGAENRRALTTARRPAAARIALRMAMAAVALVALVATTGCQRRSAYKPLPADTTSVNSDSLVAALTAAQQSWDSGSGEAAAKLSATAMLGDIRQRPFAEWNDRARDLLDSLAIGGEVGHGGAAVMVNFFSRSDPDHGSWPYLFWLGAKGARTQGLEGRDLRFTAMTTLPEAGIPATVAVLFARRAAPGSQPLAMVWKTNSAGALVLAQTLGPDSLGGSGSGEFAVVDSMIEMNTRTYRPAKLFEECPTCPHLYSIHHFRWEGSSFRRLYDEALDSPYAAFVRFVQAVAAGDRDAARAELADESLWDDVRNYEWDQPRGLWRVAPTTDETGRELTFFRGQREAYRVTFDGRNGDWRITGIIPTRQSVE